MSGGAARGRTRESGDRPGGAGELPRALGLTFASALAWGVAHLATGRRAAGGILLGLQLVLVTGLGIALTVYRADLIHLAVRPDWLQRVAAGAVILGVLWITVVIRSYQLLRPERMSVGARAAGAAMVAVLCFGVAVPVAWSAHSTYVYRDALTSIFRAGGKNGRPVDAKDPWNGQARVNILLLGGDAAKNREGVRTDSMTVASVDTRTGDTVLLSLPRNLESFPMPPGPARDRFPYGFTGDGPASPGLLNEVFQYAEEHPDIVPGAAKGDRGPELLKATISGILGLRIDYHILVDMFGFADIVDAMGGVRVTITEPIPYGLQGQVLQPGTRKLDGKEALWYGRSRTFSSDYVRMGRQKCLMRAIARQADPQTVLTKFDRLAAAAKRTLSTDIPQELLPALITLADKVKGGAGIDSLQFVPPLISTGNPDFALIRRLTARAVAGKRASPSPTATAPEVGTVATPSPAQGATPRPTATQAKPLSLDAACPS